MISKRYLVFEFSKRHKFFKSMWGVLLIIIFTIQSVCGQDIEYKRIYLSGKDASEPVEWEFQVSDGMKAGKWSNIPVPSNWELNGFGNYNYGRDFTKKNSKIGDETGRYRHGFELPDLIEGSTVKLVFDGVMTDTKVWVNGKLAGDPHQGGFYRFSYDISGLLNYGGSNILEVKVDKRSSNESINRAEREADFWIFGGIFRPVYLEILPPTHFERIAINPKASGEFIGEFRLNRDGEGLRSEVEIFDLKRQVSLGKLSGAIQGKVGRLEGNFEGIDPWHPENPVLYLATYRLLRRGEVLYTKEEMIGFRTVELRQNDGFYINGIKTIFKGVNRHSFNPKTGRALSYANQLEDIRLIKEMNMNAVRSSHYPPDEDFLDLCDSLGLFVLNEVTGWQDGYDTIVGPRLVRETVLAHSNHPSVIIWNHGNEGGWTFENEKGFHEFDLQKRPVLYPWLQRNKVDTYHYPRYRWGINRLSNGADPFMPTELLHGLHDGGLGAGLEDFWMDYLENPLFSGAFLWAFADEAVVRTDRENFLDADGNQGPDGILGPFREKEGSFFTIKEIWSPVQIKPLTVTKNFDGRLFVENNYLITNLKDCKFSYKLIRWNGFQSSELVSEGVVSSPDIPPGETRSMALDVKEFIGKSDLLELKAVDKFGMEIQSWSWPISLPEQFAAANLEEKRNVDFGEVNSIVDSTQILARVGGVEFRFSLKSGKLLGVNKDGQDFYFKNGPFSTDTTSQVSEVSWRQGDTGELTIEIRYDGYPTFSKWELDRSGILSLETGGLQSNMGNIQFLGVSFELEESSVKGVKWVGKGPYRVWKNRIKGTQIGLWEKEYNNTITGHSFENLIYPEFKGYHANFYGMELFLKKGSFQVFTSTPNLFLRLLTPEFSPYATSGVKVPFPEGDISFLLEIPAIGTKFKDPDALGPKSQKSFTGGHIGDSSYPIKLWFDFTK